MKYPSLVHADQLVENETQAEIDGNYVVARPLGYPSLFNRIRLAWMVFTGRADALIYIGQ